MNIVFKDILQSLADRADSLKAKIKKYGNGKNAKPYEEELRSLEKQLKEPMLVMQDKARSVAITDATKRVADAIIAAAKKN